MWLRLALLHTALAAALASVYHLTALSSFRPGSPHYGVAPSLRAVDRSRGHLEGEGERSARHHPHRIRVRARHLDIGRRNVHILWHNDGSNSIQYLRSTDGGVSFEPIKEVVNGVVSLRGHLPMIGVPPNSFPHFDGGKFRVLTIVTSCTAPGGRLIVAWADMREGRSRIYFRRSDDEGVSWQGPASGQPLLPSVTYGDFECFHPQIVCTTATGVVGCSFYVFGRWQGIEPPRQHRRASALSRTAAAGSSSAESSTKCHREGP